MALNPNRFPFRSSAIKNSNRPNTPLFGPKIAALKRGVPTAATNIAAHASGGLHGINTGAKPSPYGISNAAPIQQPVQQQTNGSTSGGIAQPGNSTADYDGS
jgi:hypothetical protein